MAPRASLTVGNGDSGNLFVGYTGQGTLSVEGNTQSKGQVTADSVVLGGGPYATSHVIVDGGILNAGYEITVGVWAGNASPNTVDMTIKDGGQVTTGRLRVGGMDRSGITNLSDSLKSQLGPANGSGTVNVQSDSTLTVTGPAYIGYAGSGTVNVNTGGQVTTYETALGVVPGSSGTLTVDGANGGAVYHVSHNDAFETQPDDDTGLLPKSGGLIVGGYGTGTATVKNGGQVTADNVVYVGGYHAGELPITSYDGTTLPTVANGTGSLTIQDHASSLTTNTLAVGATGTGSLHLSGDTTGQALLTTTQAGIGVASGSHGDATVGNAGAWANSGSMFVGGYGTGTLTLQSGGHVSVGEALYVGGFKTTDFTGSLFDYGTTPDGTGTVTVTGNGSALSQAQLDALGIAVGKGGTGTLQIQNGGRVDSQIGVVGVWSPGTGSVVVDGANSLWKLSGTNADVPTDVPTGGSGTVTVSNGGTIQVDGSKAALYVGDRIMVGSTGQGTMSIANGGTVQTGKTIIGGTMNPAYETIEQTAAHAAELGTGTGTVTLTGAASTWQAQDVFVGFSGNGTLNVTDGQVINETGWLGGLPNVTGTATISGATAQWTNEYNLTVGMFGQGVLNIENGAHVTTPVASIGGMPFGFANESFNPNLIANGTGTVTVTGAGSTLDVTSSDTLYVGYSGTGTLNVNSGGTATTDTALVGFRPGVTGSVNVQDSGSTFSASGQTVVGAWGTGNLNITNGGQVTTDTLSVGGFDPTTITLAADVAGGLTNPNGTGQVTVTGTGSSLSITGQNPLTLGAGGTGTLTVSNGGQVTSPDNFVGGYLKFTEDPVSHVRNVSILSGTGTAQVTGAGSQWHTNALVVGVGGAGTLDISNGGQADSHLAAVGMGAQSTGTATVTGSGSAWTIAPGTDPQTDTGHGALMVGGWGQGTLTVASGGRVDAAKMAIGGFDLATISDANMVWNFGTPTGTGTVTVTGAASGTASQLNMTDSGPLVVGYSGAGTLNVNAGGHVASGDGFIGYLAGSTGTVNVTGADSKWNLAGNLFVGGTDTAAGGTGTLNVSDGGLVDVTGDLTVWSTGTLRGNGTVTVETATTLHNYGTIAPGSATAVGTLTVNGNVVFEPGSTYAVKISQAGSDKLEVNGDTTINGGTVKLSSVGTVVGQHDYQILHATSVTIPEGGTGFGSVPDTALLTFSVSDSSLAYDPTSIMLHITAANFNDPTIAQTPNQQQIGGALQGIANSGGNDVTHALQQLETPAQLQQAYNQLSALSRPPLAPVAAMENGRFLDTVSGRVQSLQTGLMAGTFDMGPVAVGSPESRMGSGRMCDFAGAGQSVAIGNGSNVLAESPWGIWGRGYGLFGDRQTEKDAPGYNYQMGGGALGLDYQFTDKFLAGVVFGYTNGYVDFAGMRDNSDFRAIHAGLYGNLTWDKWYLNSTLAYGNVHYDTERFVDLTSEHLTGDLNGNDWTAYFEGGQNVSVTPTVLLQPFVSLQYSLLGLGSYTETGGASALSFGIRTINP